MQVLPLAIGQDPFGRVIKATFEHTLNPDFLDGVGEALLQLAAVVPHGMLAFVPSYKLMDRLVARWRETGIAPCEQQTCPVPEL